MIVVDASVAVKWFLEEPLSAHADALHCTYGSQMMAPDLLLVEVSGALVRSVNVTKANRPNVLLALDRFVAMVAAGEIIVERVSEAVIRRAADIAMDLGNPLKDCIYLVLAMDLDCPLVTADTRFAARARKVYESIRMLGE